MSPARGAATALLVVAAVVVQAALLARLPLPAADPDLVLVVVVAVGLLRGPAEGMLTGFAAGLLVDLLSLHALGLGALALCVTGLLAGVVADEAERSTVGPILAVAGLSLVAAALFAGVAALTGDPRVTLRDLLVVAPVGAAYDAVLAPFVVPALAAVSSRLDPERRP